MTFSIIWRSTKTSEVRKWVVDFMVCCQRNGWRWGQRGLNRKLFCVIIHLNRYLSSLFHPFDIANLIRIYYSISITKSCLNNFHMYAYTCGVYVSIIEHRSCDAVKLISYFFSMVWWSFHFLSGWAMWPASICRCHPEASFALDKQFLSSLVGHSLIAYAGSIYKFQYASWYSHLMYSENSSS